MMGEKDAPQMEGSPVSRWAAVLLGKEWINTRAEKHRECILTAAAAALLYRERSLCVCV